MKTKIVLFALLAINTLTSKAQEADTIPVKDGYYLSNKSEGKSTPFFIQEPNAVDIKFYKRIWRDIDLKDAENGIFITPGATLIESIVDALKKGELTAYDPQDDSFKKKYSLKEALSSLTDSILVPKYDQEGNKVSSKMVMNDFNPLNIHKFRIKEDIFYNKQRGKIETRIIGIAPLKKIGAADDIDVAIGDQPTFWLYFPQARYVLVNMDITDPDKDIYDLSMDDIFIQRRFKSLIIRESKPNGERIADYAKSEEDFLKESNRIEQSIRDYKANTWAYPVSPTVPEIKEPKTIKNKDKSKKTSKTDLNN